jgi:lipopolysaccharide assembly outer membrane protein LptD (OstA)
MKKIFLILSLILVFGINSYAQEEVKNENELTYSADELVNINSNKEIITLIGNANLKTSVFEFQNADKIIIDKVSKEVIVYGAYKVIMNGGTIQETPKLKKNQLRYKIGESVAYIE